MVKKYNIKIFISEIYKTPPMRDYPTNEIVYNHIDEIWSIDLTDMIDYKLPNNKVFKYIFVILDNYSKFLRAIPLKNKNSQTKTEVFSNILSTSEQSPLKKQSNRVAEFCNFIFQNFVKSKNIQHYPRFTDKGPSVAERFN